MPLPLFVVVASMYKKSSLYGMTLTTAWMSENFARFNREYFNAGLPTPRFIIVDSTKFYGQCGAKNWRAEHPDFYLQLSIHKERTEYLYQCTLLHEMIHLYWQSKGEWDVGHGDKFVEMALLFRRLGWNIHFAKVHKSQHINGTGKQISKQLVSKPMLKDGLGTGCFVCARPRVTWLKIWCTQALGEVQVHCKFVIDKAKEKTCCIVLAIYEQKGDKIVNIDPDALPDAYKYESIKETMCLKRTLTANFDSTIWKDLRFNIPYSVLVPTRNKFLSISGFKKKRMFHMKLSILFNGKPFNNGITYKMKVCAEKKFMRKIKYYIE